MEFVTCTLCTSIPSDNGLIIDAEYDNYARRFDYWNFMLCTLEENPCFFSDILYSQASTFTWRGTDKNMNYRSLENPGKTFHMS